MLYLLTVNYNCAELIERCLNSLSVYPTLNYQIIIVNNSPEDSLIQHLKHPNLTILNAETNLGFGQGCNLGINWIYQQDTQAIIWLINPDTFFLPQTLEKLDHLLPKLSHISILGTHIKTDTDKNWFGGGQFIPSRGAIVERNLCENAPQQDYIPCDWVSGCSVLLNLAQFPNCPYFDPAYFLYYEDFDFCYRYAKQGHTIAITPQISLIHTPSSTTNRNPTQKLKHSTYSYLLTLRRYAPFWVFLLRFLRVLVYGLVLLWIKPKIGLGKLQGIQLYWFSYNSV
ncbi:glycosyltransferase family 2 protein [Spirulina sp. CS-785/01]|uniref:glycosyltransferase family 2 protein n=1 Tax=Spirulina sp. CS-785/01 TaxID=3021716 RepID=UPI00232DE91D|nr:glycosyltransferase family 2 protein [Spirulina sp. CS-785/01]MDB9315497.1 glycosyltransferase family 2 protein [Spirulina sp. CS-785/01]